MSAIRRRFIFGKALTLVTNGDSSSLSLNNVRRSPDFAVSLQGNLDVDMDYSIILENVSYTYSQNLDPALKNINLRVVKGERVMVTGPSGSGKTTLCRCLNGLIPHYFRGKLEGKVSINGVDSRSSTIAALSHKAGLLFQDPASQLVCPTVAEEVAFGPENYAVPPPEIRSRVQDSLKAVRLERYSDRSPIRSLEESSNHVLSPRLWRCAPRFTFLMNRHPT